MAGFLGAMNNATRASDGQFDLIDTAMRFLSEDQKNEIVKAALRADVRDVVRQRCNDDLDVLLSTVGEKLQRKMNAENCDKFHAALYEATGIDARKPMFRAGQYAVDKIEQIAKLAQYHQNNSARRNQR
jgi:hypothetical protein